MTVRVALNIGETAIDETFSGPTAEDVVAAMRASLARHAPPAVGLVMRFLTPVQFARQAVARYAEATGRALPPPASCAEFLDMACAEGFAAVIDDP